MTNKKIDLFDTHLHLFEKKFLESGFSEKELIEKAQKNGVEWICNVGFTLKNSQIVVEQVKRYKNLIGAVGIHPNYSNEWNNNTFFELEKLLKEENILAIGEIGLDYYRKIATKDQQTKCFKEQLNLAKKYKLPVLLHLRNSYKDALEIISEYKKEINGIVHCFSGTIEDAINFIDLGFLISFSGVVTFKNARPLQEIVKKISLSKIVIETDAPYLAPDPHRGRINYCEYIKLTAKKIAELKLVSLETVIETTTKNALKLFSLN